MSRFRSAAIAILAWDLVSISNLLAADPAAIDPRAIEMALRRPLLAEGQALAEIRAFCDARVAPVPVVDSAIAWSDLSRETRQRVFEQVVFRGRAAEWRDAKTRVEWEEGELKGPGYHVKKLRYEAVPGMWIPALLYVPDPVAEKAPVFMNVNGHEAEGKAAPNMQARCINLVKRGMIVLSPEWVGMGQLKSAGFGHYRMNEIDLCGSSGLAPFYLSMKRGLDVLLSLPRADPTRVGVAGLSGGGWQTIFISSLDTRVTFANPVAGYSSVHTRTRFDSDLGDSEQTPVDLGAVADYTQLTGMLAPRPALLTFCAEDNCCFRADHALQPLLRGALPAYRLFAREWALGSHVNTDPGNHNFEKDNREALYRALGTHFFPGDADFETREIPSEAELRTPDQLTVALPDKNEDFHSLAVTLAADLPTGPAPGIDEKELGAWRGDATALLREITRAHDYEASAESAGAEERNGIQAQFWRLRMGDAWTLPAVEFAAKDAKETGVTLLVSESGRESWADESRRILGESGRVIAFDPFFWGECKIEKRDFLYALLVSTVGDRPLGLQASQIAAAARWAATRHGPVTIIARGPKASLATLVAAGLERKAIAKARLADCLYSLKQVIEKSDGVDKAPELHCFGLLERFDIDRLVALAGPERVEMEATQASNSSETRR